MTIKKKIIIIISLCLAGTMMLAACKVSGSNTTEATDGTIITTETSVAAITKEQTETAAVTTPTPTPTPVTLETVVTLPVPATYASLFDGTKIYSDGSRTVILKTLVKGDQVTITGTSGQYGVTAEGSFVNLHLMSVVVTVTPTPAETTTAPTDPTAATTKAPTAATTKAPAATTAVTTAAPPVETAPPAVTTAAPATDYTAVCADIRSKLIANLEANGKWDPNFTGDVNSWGQKWWGIGWYDDGDMTMQGFADEYYNGKFAGGTITACGIDCYVADGKIYLDFQGYYVT